MTLHSLIEYNIEDMAIIRDFFLRSDTMVDNFDFARSDYRVMHTIMNVRLKRPVSSLLNILYFYPNRLYNYHTESLEKMMCNGGDHRRDLMYLLSLRMEELW